MEVDGEVEAVQSHVVLEPIDAAVGFRVEGESAIAEHHAGEVAKAILERGGEAPGEVSCRRGTPDVSTDLQGNRRGLHADPAAQNGIHRAARPIELHAVSQIDLPFRVDMAE